MQLDFISANGSSIGFIERSPLPRGVYRVPDDGYEYFVGKQDVLSGAWHDDDGNPCPRAVPRRYKPSRPAAERSLPSTLPTETGNSIGEFFEMSEAWQRFWLGLIDKNTDGTFIKDFVPFDQLTPSHLLWWWAYATQNSLDMTDGHAAIYHGKIIEGGFADYMLRVNLQNPRPIAKKYLSMTGNLYRKIGDGGKNWKMEAINSGTIVFPDDPRKRRLVPVPPPDVDDVFGKPWLAHQSVESTMMPVPNSGGLYVQSMFLPRPYGTIYPNIGIDGIILVEKSRVARIENGTLFSPYYPMPSIQ